MIFFIIFYIMFNSVLYNYLIKYSYTTSVCIAERLGIKIRIYDTAEVLIKKIIDFTQTDIESLTELYRLIKIINKYLLEADHEYLIKIATKLKFDNINIYNRDSLMNLIIRDGKIFVDFF